MPRGPNEPARIAASVKRFRELGVDDREEVIQRLTEGNAPADALQIKAAVEKTHGALTAPSQAYHLAMLNAADAEETANEPDTSGEGHPDRDSYVGPDEPGSELEPPHAH